MQNLYTWRAIRDSKDGDPAINLSNSTASMMGWLCRRTAEAHPNSTVAKLMESGKEAKDKFTQGMGIKIDSKTLRQAWVQAYALSQQQWINQLKQGMSNPTEWYFKALKAALNSPRDEIMQILHIFVVPTNLEFFISQELNCLAGTKGRVSNVACKGCVSRLRVKVA